MLRWSSETTGRSLDISAIADEARDPLIEGGRALREFVDATLDRSRSADDAREDVVRALGAAAGVRAAGVIGNFEMMNRLADGIGVPVGRARQQQEAPLLRQLGLDRIAH